MIETRPTRYFQIRPHDGREPLPAIELAESALEASIAWSQGKPPATVLNLLLEDERARVSYVEVELPGPHPRIRLRASLEDAPAGFVEMVYKRGIAICPPTAEGEVTKFLETGLFV